MPRALSSVVLVGRPNVGKSTLFNRLTRLRRAIVTSVPGTTRDALSQTVEWQGARFELIDTGGMFGASEDPLHELVSERGRRTMAEADLLVLIVDGREGLVPADRQIAQAVRETNRPVVLVINKTDDRRAGPGSLEFHQLGFEPMFPISAEHGEGTGDLLDELVRRLGLPPDAPSDTEPRGRSARRSRAAVRRLPPAEPPADDDAGAGTGAGAGEEGMAEAGAGGLAPQEMEPLGEVSVAVVGRPNAGKSSLVNRLLREERMIVSEVPGTTRDAVDTVLTWHRRQFRIVDTAGIRRPGRVARGGQVETVSVLLARRSIEAADVVVLVVDAAAGVADQDAAIAGEAQRAGRGIIIAANKWDLMKGRGPEFVKTFDDALRQQLKFLDYAPVLHISAATGERTPRLLETIDAVARSRRLRVKTPELNRFVGRVAAEHPPASPGRKHVRILYAAQTGVAPPTFVFFTNVATTFHFSYTRFLENRLREEFGFAGTPIRIHVRARHERPAGARPAAGRPRASRARSRH